jgi:hypothetical protein
VALMGVHLVLVLFAVLSFAAGFPDYKWPRWQSLLIEALCLAQLGLLATLLVLGTARFSVRFIAFAIVLTFWLIIFLDLGLDHEDWLIIFSIQIAGVCCILVVLRQFGVRVTRRRPTAEAAGKSKYRFSLRQMLVWTAAASFMLGLGTVI